MGVVAWAYNLSTREDQKFKVILGYMCTSRSAWATLFLKGEKVLGKQLLAESLLCV